MRFQISRLAVLHGRLNVDDPAMKLRVSCRIESTLCDPETGKVNNWQLSAAATSKLRSKTFAVTAAAASV
jgi:hypothetical protein